MPAGFDRGMRPLWPHSGEQPCHGVGSLCSCVSSPAETLQAAARKATTSSQQKAVAEAVVSVVDAVADEGEYELALSLCELARSSAQKTRQFGLAKELAAKIDGLKKLQRTSQEYRDAMALLEKEPTDPAANLAVGRHLCLVKDDWERGVPMLALGSDAELKAVATKDLGGANSAEEQAALGDAWWALAEKTQGPERDTLRLLAGFWYRQAEPSLAGGLAGLKVKQRLEEISKLRREIPTASRVPAASQSPPLAIAPFDERTAKQHQTLWAKYLNVPVVKTNAIGMRFMLIPPGEFDMGSTAEEVAGLLEEAKTKNAPGWHLDRLHAEAPKHRVKITKPFYLGLCEVTQAEFARLMGQNPSKFQGNPNGPVEMVSWDEAAAFCRKLGELPQERASHAAYRLPTEGEWEHACRAGSTSRFCFGDSETALSTYAWFDGNSGKTTHAVGQKNPNAWGLYDMHGNVSEWCADGFSYSYPSAAAVDPLGPISSSIRVNRGGSWLGIAQGCRSAMRYGPGPSQGYDNAGFRVARTLSGYAPSAD